MNVRFHTADDQYVPVTPRAEHKIGIYPEAKHAVMLAWLRKQTDVRSREEANRLAKQLANHWLDESDRRQLDHRLLGTIGALREAIKVDPSPANRKRLQEAIVRLAEFDRLVTLGNSIGQESPVEKIDLMKKILALKPDYARRAANWARCMRSGVTSRRPKHTSCRAAADDPEDSYCVVTLGALAYREGRLDESVALYAKADRIEPNSANTHHLWGRALLRQNRFAEAEAHFRQALAVDPKHAEAFNGLNESLRYREPLDQAAP